MREFLPERHTGDLVHTTFRQQLQLFFRTQLKPGQGAVAPLQPDPTQVAVVWHPVADLGAITLLPQGLAPRITDFASGRSGPVYLGDLA